MFDNDGVPEGATFLPGVGLIVPPVDYQITQQVDMGNTDVSHTHLVIETAEYGQLAVCSVDGIWSVAPTAGQDEFEIELFMTPSLDVG